MRVDFLLIASIATLVGCASTERISIDDLNKYSTLTQLYADKNVADVYSAQYSDMVLKEIIQPYVYAKDFCESKGFKLKQAISYPSTLAIPNNTSKALAQNAKELISESFGVFNCVDMIDQIGWGVKITNSGSVYQSKSWRSTTVYVDVIEHAQIIALHKEERQRIKNEAEAQKIKQEKDAELAKRNKIAEDKRRKEAFIKMADFRSKLSEGFATNCGPVIEVKENLVKVYHTVMNYGNEHWIEKSKLFDTNYSCSFVNGTYRPPML
ncbi:hypothetical protein [Vibrio splendidus]|uniref:hypothetical protein n=1 Tax=Vibrio splendidus TaxID=29497 RepID=UPI0010560DC7|nr:hypothetical protein [Vibrio splendidus]